MEFQPNHWTCPKTWQVGGRYPNNRTIFGVIMQPPYNSDKHLEESKRIFSQEAKDRLTKFVEDDLPLDTTIWRYMSLEKFLDLLEKKELHFARGDKFEDPFEGSFTVVEKKRQEKLRDFTCNRGNIPANEQESTIEGRASFLVSCWHKNNNEDMAMWQIYGGKNNPSVAIVSTVEFLTKSLLEYTISEPDLIIGNVRYLKPEEPHIPLKINSKALLWCDGVRLLHKQHPFKYENEVRAIFDATDHIPLYKKASHLPTGISVLIDINLLINKIIISPLSLPSLTGTMEKILKTYDMDINLLEKSSLSISPIFMK
jgi:hypothetical protein